MYRLSRVKHGFLFNWIHFDESNESTSVVTVSKMKSAHTSPELLCHLESWKSKNVVKYGISRIYISLCPMWNRQITLYIRRNSTNLKEFFPAIFRCHIWQRTLKIRFPNLYLTVSNVKSTNSSLYTPVDEFHNWIIYEVSHIRK